MNLCSGSRGWVGSVSTVWEQVLKLGGQVLKLGGPKVSGGGRCVL